MTQLCECDSIECEEILECSIERSLRVILIAKTCPFGPNPGDVLVDEGETFWAYEERTMKLYTKPYLVRCEDHEGPQPCYMICEHVLLHQAVVARHHAPRDGEMGEMLCRPCWSKLSEGKIKEVISKTTIACKACALRACAGRLPQ